MVKDDEDDDDFSLSIACQIDLVHYEYFAMANKQIYDEKNFHTQSIDDNFSVSRPINDQPPNSLSNRSNNGRSPRRSISFKSTHDM